MEQPNGSAGKGICYASLVTRVPSPEPTWSWKERSDSTELSMPHIQTHSMHIHPIIMRNFMRNFKNRIRRQVLGITQKNQRELKYCLSILNNWWKLHHKITFLFLSKKVLFSLLCEHSMYLNERLSSTYRHWEYTN